MFFFACPKKNQKKTPAKDYIPFAGGSYVDQLYIVISALVILFLGATPSKRIESSVIGEPSNVNVEFTLHQS